MLTHFSDCVTFLGDVPDETHAKTQPRPSDGSSCSSCPASPAGPESGSALGRGKRQGSRERQGGRSCISRGGNSGASAEPLQPANQLLCYGGNTLPFRPAPVQDRVGWRDPVQTGHRGRPDGPQRPLPHRLHLCHPGGAHELVEELEENESEKAG